MRSSILLAALLLAAPATAQTIDPGTKARIDRILKKTPLIDGHNDLPWALRQDFGLSVEGLESGTASRTPPLMTDMARLRAGRVGGQLWSVYISGTMLPANGGVMMVCCSPNSSGGAGATPTSPSSPAATSSAH